MSDPASPRDARSIPAAVRAELLVGPCHYCAAPTATVLDHVHPVVQGGGPEAGNLVPACLRCNSEKGGKTPSQWRTWRQAQGLPWPPPNVAETFKMIASLLNADDQRALLASMNLDGVVDDAIDTIFDRIWASDPETGLNEDLALLEEALQGAELRVQAAIERLEE